MADGHDFISSDSDDEICSKNNPSDLKFPLSTEKGRKGLKIKWLGELSALKQFVKTILMLEGIWAFTENNGGFHFLKSDFATISFYPTTRTLNVQGSMKDKIKQHMLSYVSLLSGGSDEEEDSGAEDYNLRQANFDDVSPTSGKENNQGEENTMQVKDSNCFNLDAPPFIPEITCNGCQKNCSLIEHLTTRLDSLEEKFSVQSNSPSYNELLCELKRVKEERDSLLTTIRLLMKDQTSNKSETGSTSKVNTRESSRSKPLKKNKVKTIKPTSGESDMEDIPNVTQGIHSSHEKEKTAKEVVVLGDSITKYINGNRLSRKHRVKSISFPGATVEDMEDFAKPYVRKSPKKVVLHVGTNNIKQDKPKQLKSKIMQLAKNIKSQNGSTEIAVSSITYRNDQSSLNAKIEKVNNLLEESCLENNIKFIWNSNIKHDCLNSGGLHLNVKGTINLAANFRKFINLN